MTKLKFILSLHDKLSGLPQDDVEERLNFYSEMIEDRMEEGVSEEEAVAAVGSVDEVAAQIISDIPLAKIAKEKITPKRKLRAWEIVLLVLGSPLWIVLIAAAFIVLLALYAVLWSVIGSLWAVFGAFAGCALGGVLAGALFASFSNVLVGLALIGAACVCAGLAVFSFFGCMAATKGGAWLTKRIALGIKKCFVGREKK